MSIFAEQFPTEAMTRDTARIFLSGDVMTGRGIDQILPTHVTPFFTRTTSSQPGIMSALPSR